MQKQNNFDPFHREYDQNSRSHSNKNGPVCSRIHAVQINKGTIKHCINLKSPLLNILNCSGYHNERATVLRRGRNSLEIALAIHIHAPAHASTSN